MTDVLTKEESDCLAGLLPEGGYASKIIAYLAAEVGRLLARNEKLEKVARAGWVCSAAPYGGEPIDALRDALQALQESALSEPGKEGRDVTIHREVLRLLGDDATPERAIEAAERGTATYIDSLKAPDGDDNDARFAWYGMLAAAAIRAMEATAARDRAREDRDNLHDMIQAELKAVADYHALRDWRKA